MGSLANIAKSKGRWIGKELTPTLQKLEKEFLESGGEFKSIQLKELFIVQSNPQLNKESFVFSDKAEYPYFTRTVLNNGIAGYVEYLDDEHKIAGNCLAVGMLGMQFFYMQKDFYAGQFTKSAYPIKNKISKFNKNIAQYFIVLLNRYQKVFQGMLVRDFEKTFYEIEVCIPMRDYKVDLTYIEQYMRELKKERLRELQLYLKVTNLSNYELTDDEINVVGGDIHWSTYCIGDLFDIFTGRDIIIGKTTKGDIPLISHQHANNGISCYIERLENRRVFDFNNTLPLADRGVFLATTQNQNFHIGTRVKALKFKTGNKSKEERLFFVTAINKLQVLFMEYSANATDRLPDFEIKLPTKNNQIDYDYMATFIKAIQKLIIKDLVLYTERELKAYEQVIG